MFNCCKNMPEVTTPPKKANLPTNASLAQKSLTPQNTADSTNPDGEGDAEYVALRDAFKVYDVNDDKVINKEELKKVLESYHGSVPTEQQLGKILNKVDLNSDGVIDFNEFVKMMQERLTTRSTIQAEFEAWDTNNDGYISREELKKLLNTVEETPDEEIDEILAMADSDKDGQINFEEFIKFFK